MPWQYSQSSGQLSLNDQKVEVGYSGSGQGRNNPAMEMVSNVGPLPRGRYAIGAAYTHATKGPVVMSLTPVGHSAHGRSHFLIHGDSRQHPGEASQGCIVLSRTARNRVATSGDTQLTVVE
jgi:Protein of unknown function (DUF2778)